MTDSPTPQTTEPPELSTPPESPNPPAKPLTKPVGTNRRAWIVGGVLSLAALGLFVRSRRAAAPASSGASESASAPGADAAGADAAAEPIAVEVASVALKPVETIVSARGTLVAAQGASARVAVVAPGRLLQVLVREGDRVSAGQLLALVDNRTAQAGERSAQAALSASLADVRQAEIATRATQSDQSNTLKQAQLALQSAITERDGAVRQAAIALRSAQSDLRKTQVGARAPDISNALQQAQLGLKSARLDRDASVRAARNALQTAQSGLDKLQAGARAQEIAQAQAVVTQAQATRDRAATEVERVQFLFDKGIRARRELDDAKTALTVAEASLKSANDALSLLRAGARPQDIQAAELAVEGARGTVEAARQSGAAKVLQAQSALELARGNVGQASQQRPEDVRAATLKVSGARDALRQAQQNGDAKVLGARAALEAASRGGLQVAAKAEDARSKQALAGSKEADLSAAQVAASSSQIRAPIGGVVARRLLNPGDMADPATPVVEINNPDELNLLANLSGESASRVQAGMAARVTTSAAAGRVFMGRVASVGQIDPQTSLLAVRVSVPNVGGVLKVGAFANADIILQTKPLAVVVPKAAILSRDGKSVVLTVGADGKAHQQEVTTGVERNGLVEIVRGLKAGERVIQAGGYQLDDGAPVKVGDPKQAASAQAAAGSAAGGAST